MSYGFKRFAAYLYVFIVGFLIIYIIFGDSNNIDEVKCDSFNNSFENITYNIVAGDDIIIKAENNTVDEEILFYDICTLVNSADVADKTDFNEKENNVINFTEIEISDIKYENNEVTAENDNLYLLAHLIGGESGSDWCSDAMQLYVGSVVLNRVNSEYFPNNIHDVIFQDGQYACTWDGNFYREVSDRCFEHAQYLLENGSVLPENVVFQAEFTQGSGVYIIEQNQYFCYY